MIPLQDTFSRVIDYMRLSIIDRCNLRCIYCMPSEGILPSSHAHILSYEEILRILQVAARLGVKKVRITGGEPLVRRNLPYLISEVRKISGIEDLSMTTNGLLLEKYAAGLAEAGLDRVNVSIDSLVPQKYREITRGGDLAVVLRGLAAAEKAGLSPLKINMVPIRGINDNEIPDFARLTLAENYHVRFIECMPSGNVDFWNPDRYMTTDEIRGVIGAIAPLSPVKVRKNGPSKYFRLEGAKGVIGFISALSHHFCGECNRLRLTADGKLRPCLFSETEIDLRSAMRAGAPDEEIERLLRLAVEIKPKRHEIMNDARGVEGRATRIRDASVLPPCFHKRPMSKIGG